jgi:hypothetical protein
MKVVNQKRKNKLTLEQEKEIYEAQWREVYDECFYQGIVNKEKLASIIHSLNMAEAEIIRLKHNEFEKEHGPASGIVFDREYFKEGK